MDGASTAHGGTTVLPFSGEAIPTRRDIDLLFKGGQPKTLNEMETELHSLHKENFDLKMTIYYQKDKIERLNGGEMDSGERERDLEEHIADLEYRMQEKDARLAELEAFLAQHQHAAQQQQFHQQNQQQASRDLKDEMRQVSGDAAAEALEAFAREKAKFEERLTDMQAMLGQMQNKKQAAEEDLAQARVEAAELQQKVLSVEEAKGMLQREMDARLHEARRASEDTQKRHLAELARAQQEATEASNAATAAASQLVAVSSQYQQQQQQQQQQHSTSSSSWVAIEEHRSRAEEAERKVRDLEERLGHYQAELQELSRDKGKMGMGGEDQAAAAAAAAAAATAASASATAAMWKESLGAARRELQRERAEKEGALRALEQGREALNREKEEMRLGEKGTWTELNLLRDQLANEKRAKDALLLDMADIRRHGKQQIRELLSELKDFDSVVEENFAELFETAASAADAQQVPINTPLKALLAAEEDAGRRRGLLSMGGMVDPSPTKQLALALGEEREGGRKSGSSSIGGSGSSISGSMITTGGTTHLSTQASGKLMVRQAQDLVRKWRLKLQVLPSLNQRFRDATASTIHTFEAKLSQMTARLSTQEDHVHDAYKKIETLRAARTEVEENHARELVRAKRTVQVEYQELLAQVTAEKNALAARLTRLEAEVAADVQEAREAGRKEGKQEEEVIKGLKADVAIWAKRCEAEAEGRARAGQEKEVVVGEKRRMQVEMDRLLRQVRYRDDVIAVFKETLEAHGLDDLPQIGAQLALLHRHMEKGGWEREGGQGSSVMTLIKEGMEHAAAHLMTVGTTQGWETRELLKRAEELKVYGGEVASLVRMTQAMLQQQQQQQQQELWQQGKGREGGAAVWKLLEENDRVAKILRGLYLDLQRLVQRLLPPSLPSSSSTVTVGRYESPLRRPVGGRREVGGVSPYASPALDRRRQPSSFLPGRSHGNGGNSGKSNNFSSPVRSHAAGEELLLRSTSFSYQGGQNFNDNNNKISSSGSSSSRMLPAGGGMKMRMTTDGAAASGGEKTPSPSRFSSLGGSFGSSCGGREGEKEGGVLTRHQVGSGGMQKPLANLEKISNDLQEIASKLEHFRGSGGGGRVGGSDGGGEGGGPVGAVIAGEGGRKASTVLNRLK